MDKEFIILLKKDWNYLLELIDNAYKGNTDIGAVVKQIHRIKPIEDMADESIRFADWINKNDYEKIHGDRWCKKFMSYTHSTVELFEIFIQSLNKQD